MKNRTIVGTALALSFLAAGTIILFGMADGMAFNAGLFILMLSILVTVILAAGAHSMAKGNLIALIFAAVIFSVFFTFFTGALKGYNESVLALQDAEAQMAEASEATQLSTDYNKEYIDYLDSQTEIYRASSSEMQATIDSIRQEMRQMDFTVPEPVVEPVVEPEPVIVYVYEKPAIPPAPAYDDDDEREDDEEEEDD
jgi:hypothetical protein